MVRKYLVPFVVLLLLSTMFSLSCGARGSGGKSVKSYSPAAGYKSGNYSASKSTPKTTKSSAGAVTNKSSDTKSASNTKNDNSSNNRSGGGNVVIVNGGNTYNNGGGYGSSSRRRGGGGVIIGIILIIAVLLIVFIFVRRAKNKNTDGQYSGESFDVKSELDEYKELYSKLVLGIDDVHDFVEKADLDKRRCVKLLPVITQYISILENSVGDGKHKAPSPENALKFKQQHQEELEKLHDCAECKCLKCTRDCKMAGCSRCEPSFRCKLASCDNEKAAVYTVEGKTVDLTNNDSGETESLKVLAVVQDLEYKQFYIILERSGEKVVLYYYPEAAGDTYGEVTDQDDLNFAINAYEGIFIS